MAKIVINFLAISTIARHVSPCFVSHFHNPLLLGVHLPIDNFPPR